MFDFACCGGWFVLLLMALVGWWFGFGVLVCYLFVGCFGWDIVSLFSLQVAACVYVDVCLPVFVGFMSVGVAGLVAFFVDWC